MKTPTVPLVLLGGVLAVGSVSAQNEPARGPSAQQLENYLKRFPESDANKDGKLTAGEALAHRREEAQAKQPALDVTRAQRLAPTHANVAYGDYPRQVFDVWIAPSKDGKPTPMLIYIHGGGFRGGDKNVAGAAVQQALDAGVSFASLSYRLTEGGANPYPIAMHDCARALQTLRSRAKEWNLDQTRIASYGGSAGAGISLWLAFHDDLAKPNSADPIARESTRLIAAGTSNGQSTYDMRTFREWFGVPNLPPHPALTDLYAVKTEADWDSERVRTLMTDASAITHLTKDDVPVFMTYGAGDVPVDVGTNPSVWVHHIRLGYKLKEAMDRLGIPCAVTQGGGDGTVREFLIEQLLSAKWQN